MSAATQHAPIIIGERLTEEHLAHLRTSGLSDDTLVLAGIYSLRKAPEVAEALGRQRWRNGGGAIAFPCYRPGRDQPELLRVRPDHPRTDRRKGREREIKYDQRAGTPVAVYYPPRTRRDRLRGDGIVVWTEGEKKALALDELGYCAIGLTGVYNAHDKAAKDARQGWKLHPWLREDLRIEGREHVIAYDADVSVKPDVMKAARRLAGMLLAAGARTVRMVAIPLEGPKGIDDVYVALGADAVHALVKGAEPLELEETRPEVWITVREDEVNAAAIGALSGDPDLYQRARSLVRVLPARGDDAPTIQVLPTALLRERLAAAASWMFRTEGEPKPTHPPRWAVEAIHARGEWEGIRPLAGLVEQPTLRPDGTVIEAPGYDDATGLLYLRPAGVTIPKVPQRPTLDDARRALAALRDVVCDVCFERPHHRSAWLALVLTLVARHAIRGPVPMFHFDAPVAGAGKGLSADAACRIGTGRPMPQDGMPSTDEEMDKRVLAWALAGRAVVGLDNVTRLAGDSLCRALTAEVVGGRYLGRTEEKTAPMRCVFVSTGNNVALGPDMHRRICPARIVPHEEDPSLRTGFRHPDLPAHVMANRPALVVAALTVLRAYTVAARPDQRLPAWGSFEAWSELVRGALVWAGEADPAAGREELRKVGDDHAARDRALVLAWRELVRLNDGPLTAAEAVALVARDHSAHLRQALEAVGTDKRGALSARTLGYALRPLRQRVFAGNDGVSVMLDSSGQDRNSAVRWTVAVGGETDRSDQSAGDAGDAGDV